MNSRQIKEVAETGCNEIFVSFYGLAESYFTLTNSNITSLSPALLKVAKSDSDI
jgi:hypothetical protein